MPQHDKKVVEGEITEVFAHRIVVRTAEGSALADLGPKMAGDAKPAKGDRVRLTGEQKPSELKVAAFERGGRTFEADDGRGAAGADGHKGPKKHGEQPGDPEAADPEAALEAVRAKGHTVVAGPHRKPKHFEILAEDGEGAHHEHHVGLDGEHRKSKAGDPADKKWKPAAPKAA